MTASPHVPRNPRIFWPCFVIGWAVIGLGIRGLLRHAPDTEPVEWTIWFLAAAVAHDFVLAPIVFAIGVVVGRSVPPRVRPVIQGALVVTGMVVLSSLLFAGRLGGRRGNPSALPNGYLAGLGVVALMVWGATAILLLRAWRKHA